MELLEMIETGVLNFSRQRTRKQDIIDALVDYGFLTPDEVREPYYKLLVDNWNRYVSLPKEDTKSYKLLQVRLVTDFGENNFYWLIHNTFLLHQLQYLERKNLPTRGYTLRGN
jgi:hypothetical protein